jgi:phage terminase large subunit GpA-like protein
VGGRRRRFRGRVLIALNADLWTPTERAAWQPPPRISVSTWADANRLLTSKESAEPGRWLTARTPYLRAPQDALGDPTIRFVVIVKPAQVGGSECTRNAIGYWVDADPGPALVVYPSEDAAKENMSERVGRMFRATPCLAEKLTGERHDISDLGIDTREMQLYVGWAGSPQALASRPCRYIVLDEVDKYPPYAGKDASPLALAEARTRTYAHRSKIVLVSTPTTDKGAIWTAFESCEDRRRYHVPCPLCNEFQILQRDRFRWEGYPEDPTPEFVEANGVWYSCVHCEGKIPETEKDAMSGRGEWRAEPDAAGVVPEKASRVGFQFSAFVATIGVSWRKLIAKFFRVKADPAKLMEFVTQELGEPWRDLVDMIQDSRLMLRSESDKPRGSVPPWAACVVLTADTQKEKFYWIARAWGANERSQLIDLGAAKTFVDLENLLKRAFPVIGSPSKMKPCLMLIDSGGGTETRDGDGNRTDEVYRWAGKLAAQVIALKGIGGNVNPLSAPDVRIGSHTYKRAGYSNYMVRLAHVNTQRLKDVLAARINQKPEEGKPAIWDLCADLPKEYFEHLRAEHKVGVRKGAEYHQRWVARSHGRRRDYLDCEVYQLAAAKLIGAEYVEDPQATEPEKQAAKREAEAVASDREDFIDRHRAGRGGGWWTGARR